jgi:ribosomal protein S25
MVPLIYPRLCAKCELSSNGSPKLPQPRYNERESNKKEAESYRKAVRIYEESVAQALRVCRQTVEQAWQGSRESSQSESGKSFRGMGRHITQILSSMFSISNKNVSVERTVSKSAEVWGRVAKCQNF